MKSTLIFLLLPLIATPVQASSAPTLQPAHVSAHPATHVSGHPASSPVHLPTHKPTHKPTHIANFPHSPSAAPAVADPVPTHKPTHKANFPHSPTPAPTPTRGTSDDNFGEDAELKPKKEAEKNAYSTTPASTGLTAGGKAGIAIAVILVVGVIVGFFFLKRKKGKATPRAVEVGVLDADGSSLAPGNSTADGDSVDVDLTEENLDDPEEGGESASSRIIL